MPLLVPLVAVGVALLLLLVAYAFAVIVTPIIEGMAREVPVVGRYIAGAIDSAVSWGYSKFVGYVTASLDTLLRWLRGLVDVVLAFPEAVNGFILHLVDVIEHVVHVTVHEIVHAFVNPVRDAANDALALGHAAETSIDELLTRPLDSFHGIEHGVRVLVQRALDAVENVDLPDLQNTLDKEINRVERSAQHATDELADVVQGDVAQIWQWVDSMPWQDLLALLAAVPALALLVRTITAEAGLDEAACRAKFKQVCSTDPFAWADLLALAGASFLFPGFRAMVDVARELLRDVAPAVEQVLHGG